MVPKLQKLFVICKQRKGAKSLNIQKVNINKSVKSLHLFVFFSLCVFKQVLKWPAMMSHWAHLFDFYPLSVFKCLQ